MLSSNDINKIFIYLRHIASSSIMEIDLEYFCICIFFMCRKNEWEKNSCTDEENSELQ